MTGAELLGIVAGIICGSLAGVLSAMILMLALTRNDAQIKPPRQRPIIIIDCRRILAPRDWHGLPRQNDSGKVGRFAESPPSKPA